MGDGAVEGEQSGRGGIDGVVLGLEEGARDGQLVLHEDRVEERVDPVRVGLRGVGNGLEEYLEETQVVVEAGRQRQRVPRRSISLPSSRWSTLQSNMLRISSAAFFRGFWFLEILAYISWIPITGGRLETNQFGLAWLDLCKGMRKDVRHL